MSRRRRFREEIAAGEAKLSLALGEEELAHWLKGARVGLVMRYQPGIGHASLEPLLAELPRDYDHPYPHPARLLSELTYRQRVALSLLVERYER